MVLLILNYLDTATVTKTADSLAQLSPRVSRSGIVMRIPSDADQRSEAMPITVPTIRRGADGVRYKKLLVLISESDYD